MLDHFYYYFRLVRQAHVKEELIRTNSSTEKRSPIFKTFADAKQNIPPQMIDDYNSHNIDGTVAVLNTSSVNYSDGNVSVTTNVYDTIISSDNNYISSNNDYEEQIINQNYDEASNISGINNSVGSVFYDDYNNDSSNESMRVVPQSIKSAENFMNDPSSEYFYQDDYMRSKDTRQRRRKSRELPAPPAPPEPYASTSIEDVVKRKPETMRSISEDTTVNKSIKNLPRRSMSHPEKEKVEGINKTPTPKPLAEILERQKKTASVRRKTPYKSTDQMDNSSSLSPSKYIVLLISSLLLYLIVHSHKLLEIKMNIINDKIYFYSIQLNHIHSIKHLRNKTLQKVLMLSLKK